MCETRFVECHESLNIFIELFDCIRLCLDDISQDNKKIISPKASSFLAAMEKSEFIVSILTCEKLLSFTLHLSHILQCPKLDLISALTQVKQIIIQLEDIRKHVDEEFKKIFENAKRLALTNFQVEIKLPRINVAQLYRDNHQTSSIEEYYRVSTFIPCIDNLIANLKS